MPFAVPDPCGDRVPLHHIVIGPQKRAANRGLGPLREHRPGAVKRGGERCFRPLRPSFRRSGRCLS